MAPKFRKSAEYLQMSSNIETEVLDAYADVLLTTGSPDLRLKNVPELLSVLKVPLCFTRDISQCIEWFYVTQHMKLTRESLNWPVAEQLLRHLTISISLLGVLDVSDIVDIDKLVKFCNRLLKFRDHCLHISQKWALFVAASGIHASDKKDQRISDRNLTLKDLVKVKQTLQLDNISDSILIDMLGCGRSDVDGELFNYKISPGSLQVNVKDFAEVLGLLGHYDD